MRYARRVILHAPSWNSAALVAFVEGCVRDGVVLVAVTGPDCQLVEDVIDELLVADATEAARFLSTTSHPGNTLDEVRRFAAAWTVGVDLQEPVDEVRLSA